MRHTHAIDASAVDAINKLLAQCSKLNIKLYLTHVNEQPARVLKRMGFTDRLGEENIYETKTKAIVDAYEYVQKLIA